MNQQYTKTSLIRLTVLLMKWTKPEGDDPLHIYNENQGKMADVIRGSGVNVIEVRDSKAPKGEGVFHSELKELSSRKPNEYENVITVLDETMPLTSQKVLREQTSGVYAMLCLVGRPMTTAIGNLISEVKDIMTPPDLILLDSDVHFEDLCPVWLIWNSGHLRDEDGEPSLIIDSSRMALED